MGISERILEVINKKASSKSNFASTLKVTPAYISKIINKGATPSERLIDDICEKYYIRKEWLLNGTGTMENLLAKDEQIASMFTGVLKLDEEDFKRRLVSALAKLDEDGWAKLEELIDAIAGK